MRNRTASGSERVRVTSRGLYRAARTRSLPLAVLLLCLSPLTIAAQTAEPRTLDPRLPTLFVVGDSTANNNANGARGWGDPFASLFDASKINVVNRARAGRSSRTFLTEGLWERVLQDVKAGDFVLIQFGHNDGGPVDTGRARGSLPGLGEETKEITKPDGSKEVVHTFGWYNRKLIADVRAKGATPVLLSLTVRNIWKDGRVERGSGKFRQWAEELARAEGVEFVDVTGIIAERYEALGQEKVKALFGPDHTHTSPEGADFNASAVVAGLKGLKGDPLGRYFSARAKHGRQQGASRLHDDRPDRRALLHLHARPAVPPERRLAERRLQPAAAHQLLRRRGHAPAAAPEHHHRGREEVGP